MSRCKANTRSGKRCTREQDDDLCWQHRDWQDNGAKRRAEQRNAVAQRARPGEWEAPYFAALRKGHTKRSAAALAGVTERTPYSRAEKDPDFADQEEVAYEEGTAHLESVALKRISDRKNPGDSVLKHLLAVRGVNPKKRHEHSGPDGGPIQQVNFYVPDNGRAKERDE